MCIKQSIIFSYLSACKLEINGYSNPQVLIYMPVHYQKYFLKIFLKLECISCPIVSKYKLILRKYII